MKRILGLDLGTNSIGWALIEQDFEKKEGKILGLGSRIIPMSKDVLDKFGSGTSISQTAERTGYRSVRRLNERHLLRRERLHRVLNILSFLPEHYAKTIDFGQEKGQFYNGEESKLAYIDKKNENGRQKFFFWESYEEMEDEFRQHQPDIPLINKAGRRFKLPQDWTLYYLRKKALSKKITKEELAWILLNFNQKRGYYQLRGEEEETDKTKQEEFYAFTVTDVQATENNNRGVWYNVILENGWIYRRQSKESLSNWIGKTKEFIVTTWYEENGELKLDKEGNVKRSFRAVDSEKDWIAIKKKTEKDIENSGKTVGEYVYDTLLKNLSQKIRGKLIKTIDRTHYKEELTKILRTQKAFHTELNDPVLYQSCLDELYPRNEAHQNNIKNNDFVYLFVEDILFYQRPLKSKKSTISDCPYESRSFLKDGERQTVFLKCIPKSHPLFQEFRLWQFLQNLKIYQKQGKEDGKSDVDINITDQLLRTEEDKVALFDYLNKQSGVDQKKLISYFVKRKEIVKADQDNYRWNYVEDKKYPTSPTRSQFLSRLKKIDNLNAETFLSRKVEQALWHIVYSVKDKKEFEKALATFARKKEIDIEPFVRHFKSFPPFSNDYGAYSKKAIEKLLPLMRMGKYWKEENILPEAKQRIYEVIERLRTIDFEKEKVETISDDALKKQFLKSFTKFNNRNPLKGLNTYQACYAVYERHSEAGTISHWKSPKDIEHYLTHIFKQHSLRNPIVEQVITETLRVVKDIWQHYGNGTPGFFSEIHVELGREMKNDKKTRERISKTIAKNENTNERIKALLQELKNAGVKDIRPYSPSQQEILKIYEEGVYDNAEYNVINEDEIEKIRKNPSPTKKEIERYKLWLEQGYISPYTGKIIPLSKLFTTEYQIEHIIPQSRYFDDSLSNKIICESVVNEEKGNKTAYEFIKQKGGENISIGVIGVPLLKIEDYEARCNHYFKKNPGKLKYLLSEEIPEGFINRQLNDSRYISKVVKGLLSNIVREKDEDQVTSKRIVPVTGTITSTLRQDWGLNDKWNEIVTPRFKRLNEINDSNDYGFWDNSINTFRIQVPDIISKGFSKKRIDHRHHALDALVVACITKDHINYITSLNTERKNHSLVSKLKIIENRQIRDKKTGELKTIPVAKSFRLPWENFTIEAKNALEKTIVSFKQNLRVINRTNNKTWHWEKENGQWKKRLKKQKGKNFAVRKSMHKETISGKVNIPAPKGKIATASRAALSDIKNHKHIEKITDPGIRKVLKNHLKNYIDEKGKERFDLAFNPDGIEELNKNIAALNGGKARKPVYKVRVYEIGNKFPVGETGNNPEKYVEAAKGTNLFFAVYWDDTKQKRMYETVPLNEVIAHQKQNAHLPLSEKTPIPLNMKNGRFLFSLSPNDLVYVPTDEEINNPDIVDFGNLAAEQIERIYKMVSSSGNQCFFIKSEVSNVIINKKEYSALNKMEKSIDGIMIKECCWKLKVDRLGNIKNIIKK